MENESEVGQIVEQIKSAFRPLICKAESWDYEDKIRFKVLHNGKILYEREKVLTTDLDSPDKFINHMNAVRGIVREKMRETVPSFEFDDLESIGD
jgi:hypothetical protein